MDDKGLAGENAAPAVTVIARAHAIYTPLMLSFYDRLVHCLSDRFAWRCPAERMLELYRHNLSSRHLEAGVGTGFFIDRTDRGAFEQLTLPGHQPLLPGHLRAQARALPAAMRGESAGAHRRRSRTS
jgi:hypothetical protein